MSTPAAPRQTNPVAEAARALAAEAAAIARLAETVPADPAFAAALKLVRQLPGRLIVTGVGKSGHIGGKIAATLASTGTPAFFVHPTEALHGDLGMITKQDAVLALSHSGESKELAAIVAYCSRFAIPLIALTGKPQSTLGKAAACVLNTGVTTEACPLNLAPTTSTTAALALADALAVALMVARGFGPNDFAVFHPGGKLGAQLLRVSEIMRATNLPLLPETAPMHDVLLELSAKNLGCVGLTGPDGTLTGIFTDGDLKRHLSPELLGKTAHQVMTPNPKSIAPEALAGAAVAQMNSQHVTVLWVKGPGGRPQGLLRLEDCLARGVA